MALHLEANKTAPVLTDLQHGIVAMQNAPYSSSEVVGRARMLVAAFHASGAQVVYVNVDLAHTHALEVDLAFGDRSAPPPPAIVSELVPEMYARDGDLRVTKRAWVAFAQTELERELRARGITMIVLAGIATAIGVESTARTGAALSIHVVVAEDACASLDARGHEHTIKHIFPLISRVRSTDEVIAALR